MTTPQMASDTILVGSNGSLLGSESNLATTTSEVNGSYESDEQTVARPWAADWQS